jgi:hypothetical protein
MAHHRQTKPRNPDDDAAETMHRVAAQEMKPAPRATSNLDDLGDVESLYDSDTRRPRNGQTLQFDSARPGKYHGLWVPSGGERIGGKETFSVTAEGTDNGISQRLVPSDWDERQGCIGDVSVTLDGASPFPGFPAGDYEGRPFRFTVQILPYDVSAGPPSGDLPFSEDDVFPANEAIGLGGFASSALSVPAVLKSGTPHAFVSLHTPPGVGAIDFEVRWLIRPDGPL